jgi:hypothetical protein
LNVIVFNFLKLQLWHGIQNQLCPTKMSLALDVKLISDVILASARALASWWRRTTTILIKWQSKCLVDSEVSYA